MAYLDMVEKRFSKCGDEADTTRRFAYDGSVVQSASPAFYCHRSVRGFGKESSVNGLALASALWSRYCSRHA